MDFQIPIAEDSMEFFGKYWHVILLGILSLIAGAIITRMAINNGNKKLLEQITAEINSIKGTGSRITADEQIKLVQLQAQQKLLAGKMGICTDCTQQWQKQNCPNCNT